MEKVKTRKEVIFDKLHVWFGLIVGVLFTLINRTDIMELASAEGLDGWGTAYAFSLFFAMVFVQGVVVAILASLLIFEAKNLFNIGAKKPKDIKIKEPMIKIEITENTTKSDIVKAAIKSMVFDVVHLKSALAITFAFVVLWGIGIFRIDVVGVESLLGTIMLIASVFGFIFVASTLLSVAFQVVAFLSLVGGYELWSRIKEKKEAS